MATATAPAKPTDDRRVARPEWLENLVGQGLALLGLGAIIILLYGESPLAVYKAIIDFSFTAKDGPAYVLAIATPLIFSALAVAIPFKAGLFNIGVEGQYFVGMVVAAWAALHLDFLPGPLLMWVVLLFAMLGGMVYGAIPAILKVKTGSASSRGR
jgi:ABC-type uncharacterized transport system permease subunit